MRLRRILRPLVMGLVSVAGGWVGLSVGTPVVLAQTVQYGFAMDQAFSSNPYAGGSRILINGSWTNLPWNNPAGWPLQGQNNNMWQNKPYIQNAGGSTQTVQSGQSFAISPPSSLEDVCQASNYGTRGYWRGLMVIANTSGNEAWSWQPPGGNWYGWGYGLNNAAGSCTPGQNYGAAPTFDVTAPQVSTTTTYYAKFFAEEAQYTSTHDTTVDGDISEVTVPITVEAPVVAPTVSLSASPTSLTVGQSTTLTATASNLPSGDYLTIWQPANNTEWGSGSAGENPYSEMLGHNTPQTDTFVAYIDNSAGQDVATSNTQTVTWNANAPPPSNPTVSLSAYPRSLTVGNATTLTATPSNVPAGDSVQIVGTDGFNQTGSSSTFTTTDTQYSPTTVTYTAYIVNSGGQDVATSNTQTVTWNANAPPPSAWSVSLSANPTPLPTGSATTLTAIANQNVGPTPYFINIVDMTTRTLLTSCGAGTSCTTTLTENQATTQTFQADVSSDGVFPSGSTQANSPQTSVTWTAAAPTLTLAQTQTVPVGTAVTLTGTSTEVWDQMGGLGAIVGVAGGVPYTKTGGHEYGVGGSATITGNSYTYAITSNQAGTETFQIRWAPPGASTWTTTSNTVTVTWTPLPTVHLTASPRSLTVGQTTTVLETASEDVSGTGDAINIFSVSPSGAFSAIRSCSSGSTCTALVSSSQPETLTFEAGIGQAWSSSGMVAHSGQHAVTWNAPPTVGLTASPSPLFTGQATTLTATASQTVTGTGESLNLIDVTTGTVVTSCGSGSTCTGHVTETQATTQTFQADFGPYQAAPTASGVVATSGQHAVTWYQPAVSLAASPTSLTVGQKTTLTATATHVPPGDSVQIVGTDGLSQSSNPNATVDTTTDTRSSPTTVTYTAYIVNSAGQHVATSNTEAVTWKAAPVVDTGCVPYRPGYEYNKHGQPTYNPEACPVPTPVNF